MNFRKACRSLLLLALLGSFPSGAFAQAQTLSQLRNRFVAPFTPPYPDPSAFPPDGFAANDPTLQEHGTLTSGSYQVTAYAPQLDPLNPSHYLPGFVTTRNFRVYTPPGYSKDDGQVYPVLYLLHGVGGDENDWGTNLKNGGGAVKAILDNLHARQGLQKMIVVMPDNQLKQVPLLHKDGTPVLDSNGKPVPDPKYDEVLNLPPAIAAAFGINPSKVTIHDYFRPYVLELFADLMPYILTNYPNAGNDPGHRAIAGLSEGAEQALWIGLNHLDSFSFIGAFSPGIGLFGSGNGPNPVPTPPALALQGNLKLLWMSCGTRDIDDPATNQGGHMETSGAIARSLYGDGVTPTWFDRVMTTPPPAGALAPVAKSRTFDSGHDWTTWRASLYYFAQRLSGLER